MLHIVIANITHASLIAEISRETFYDTFAEHNTVEDMELFLNEQFSKEYLEAQVGVPGNCFLLAYFGKDPVGYVFIKENSVHPQLGTDKALEVSRFYARKNAIGKGIGKAMMNAVIKKAQLLEKEAIWLCVWSQNHRAIDFYQKFGFEKFADTEFLLGKDLQQDWVMRKIINN